MPRKKRRKRNPRKRWNLLQGILVKLHVALVVGYVLNPILWGAFLLLFTGLAWMFIGYRNQQIPEQKEPIEILENANKKIS